MSDLQTYHDHYLHYSSENESSKRFHKWSVLMTLSVAASRRVWVNQGDWKVFPNLYTLFVGDAASGKSTALSFAEKLVHTFTDYPIAPNSITREMLTHTLAKSDKTSFMHNGELTEFTHMSVFSDELTMFLGAEPIRMIDFLTAIYNASGPFQIATKNKGCDVIMNPNMCFMGLLTPGFLNSMMTQNLVTGGFSRRVLMVYGKERAKPKPRPIFDDTHKASKAWCTAYARKAQQLVGPFVWTPQAEAWFDEWYYTVKDPTMRNEQNGVMKSYWTARDNLLLKVGMLCALSQKLELVLTVDALIMADLMLTELEPDILSILGGGGRNELAPIAHQIYQYIMDNPEITDSKIRARFYNSATDNEIRDVLQHLLETSRITKDSGVPGGTSRVVSKYKITT